ncbi:hypothetical protein ACFZA2_14080 [Microbacterium sp. NPDC007973]|uniref:hypothetical protein n=1 Tax=Microbacterium sp. NPDC007973 TaxID=3364182 RepID=UPI0036E7A25A
MTEQTTPAETTGQRRLREARERAAEREANPASATAIKLPTPGETVHCLVSGTTLHRGGFEGGYVLLRGQQFIVTAEMIEASRDRFGRHRGVALVHHPELQKLAHKGRVLYAPGPTPEGFEPWEYGDPAWADARERARLDAHAQRTDAERRAALAEVHRRYGPAQPMNSFTKYISAADREAEADRKARLAAARAGQPFLGSSSEGGGDA